MKTLQESHVDDDTKLKEAGPCIIGQKGVRQHKDFRSAETSQLISKFQLVSIRQGWWEVADLIFLDLKAKFSPQGGTFSAGQTMYWPHS